MRSLISSLFIVFIPVKHASLQKRINFYKTSLLPPYLRVRRGGVRGGVTFIIYLSPAHPVRDSRVETEKRGFQSLALRGCPLPVDFFSPNHLRVRRGGVRGGEPQG